MGFDPWISEWGNPLDCSLLWIRSDADRLTAGKIEYLEPEHIGFKKRTRGTETSKYPEERKSTETPLVVASERGPAELED